MLRAAKVSSWIVLCLYLAGIVAGARAGSFGVEPEILLLLLPMALALGVFYSRAHRGFAWCAFIVNVGVALLGLYDTGPAVFDVLGLSAYPSEGSRLVLLLLPLLVVLPCALNSYALYSYFLTTRPTRET